MSLMIVLFLLVLIILKLNLSNAARIVFSNKAGYGVSYSHDGSTYTEITSVCSADTQIAGDVLSSGSDCKIDSGLDLVVWTKHFTLFKTQVIVQSSYVAIGSSDHHGVYVPPKTNDFDETVIEELVDETVIEELVDETVIEELVDETDNYVDEIDDVPVVIDDVVVDEKVEVYESGDSDLINYAGVNTTKNDTPPVFDADVSKLKVDTKHSDNSLVTFVFGIFIFIIFILLILLILYILYKLYKKFKSK